VGNLPADQHTRREQRDVVDEKRQERHDYLQGDADVVRKDDLARRGAARDPSLPTDVVHADSRRDRQLELRRLRDPFGREVGGPERLRDDDLGVRELLLEDRVRTVLVGSDDEGVASLLEEWTQAELS